MHQNYYGTRSRHHSLRSNVNAENNKFERFYASTTDFRGSFVKSKTFGGRRSSDAKYKENNVSSIEEPRFSIKSTQRLNSERKLIT